MGDLIDRQAAIDAIWDGTNYDIYTREVKEILEELPSAQPEQEAGKWIKMSDADGVYYCCSECGEELYRRWVFDREFDTLPKKKSIDKTKYCPNCGAMMEGETHG